MKPLKDLEDLLGIKADRDAGRVGLAERKELMLAALRKRFVETPDFSDPPDDTVKESER